MRARSKIALGIAALAIVGAVATKIKQADIAAARFERAVSERVGCDSTVGLPNGLHIALCGTGSPLPNPSSAGPCNVVIAVKLIFVVDVGEDGGRNINMMDIPLGRIEAYCLPISIPTISTAWAHC